MKPRFIPVLFALACLILSGPACAELNVRTRSLNFTGISVTPAESNGSGLTMNVSYTAVGYMDVVYVNCYYQSADGSTAAEMGPRQQAEKSSDPFNMVMTFTFSVGTPGNYQAYCTSSDGARTGNASFRVKESATPTPTATLTSTLTPTPTATLTPTNTPTPTVTLTPTITLTPTLTLIPVCDWQVGGTWSITQVNGYHPVFEITQSGTTLSGTATLSASEASLGGYTGTVGVGAGSVDGDTFTFAVTWPPKLNGQVVTGTYTGKISDGRIDGDTWYGSGPTQCILH